MITDSNQGLKPKSGKSRRIISSIKPNPPRSSKTNFSKNLIQFTNEEFDKILKTEITKDESQWSNKDKNYSKNMNHYRHIISDSQATESNLDWILDLRIQKENDLNISIPKKIICNEPSFYKKDFDKFLDKKLKEKNYLDPISKKENFQNINHIIRDRLGEKANITQVDFELNLRNYEKSKQETNNLYLSDEKKNTIENSEWKQIPFIPKSRLFSSYCKLKSDSKNIKKNDTSLIKKKENSLKHIKSKNKEDFEKGNLKTNYSFHSTKANYTDDYLGENKSMKPYSNKYNVKNAASIQHLLKKGTNSQAAFQSGLRDY